jgi:DNA-binding MarR family transcriptional regulator
MQSISMSTFFVSYDLGMPDDPVDDAMAQWARERPDLEHLDAMALFARLARLVALVAPAIDEGLAPFGLKVGEFDVLACLRRSGEPFELTPTALGRQLLLSSGAMTNRMDRLEQAGFIRRRPDPDDRRGVLVSLTPRGRELIDEAVVAHLANEVRLLEPLGARDRSALDRAVRSLTRQLTDPPAAT